MQSTNLYDMYLMLYVQFWTPDDGRKDRPKHVEWYSINSKKKCASGWFYYRNISRCTVTWTSNLYEILSMCIIWQGAMGINSGKKWNPRLWQMETKPRKGFWAITHIQNFTSIYEIISARRTHTEITCCQCVKVQIISLSFCTIPYGFSKFNRPWSLAILFWFSVISTRDWTLKPLWVSAAVEIISCSSGSSSYNADQCN